MQKTFRSKASAFILTIIFGLIGVSFLFGNFDNYSGPTARDVGSVNGLVITVREYQTRLEQQAQFFAQMTGQALTPAQMQQMGIKENVLSQIVQQKLILSHALGLGFVAGEKELKEEIKKLPYFQREGKFDVNMYKNLLLMNQFTPAQFEEMIEQDLIGQKLSSLFDFQLSSPGLSNDVLKFKNQKKNLLVAKVPRTTLIEKIPVSETEVMAFAQDPKNLKLLEDLYTQNKARYLKPEELKAKHILFRGSDEKSLSEALKKAEALKPQLTQQNFSTFAAKESEDPSAKTNKGDLGWFTRESMVPEFSKAAFEAKIGSIIGPVKTSYGYHLISIEGKKGEEKRGFDQVKAELAKESLQKTKTKQTEEFMLVVKNEVTASMAKANMSLLNALKTKYGLSVLEDSTVNRYDLTLSGKSLSDEETKKVFNSKIDDVIDLSSPGEVFVALVKPETPSAKEESSPESELQAQNQTLGRKFREELLKELNAKAKVVTNPAML
jgi:peptidyl-prolyl cis-trans isomerase D